MERAHSLLICLVGPAAGGKTSVGNRLLAAHPELKLSISVTSRPIRSGELDGQSYFFVSRGDFEAKIKAGAFLEWEEVHGNLYGTLRSTVDEALDAKIDLVFDIDIKGALNLKKLYPQSAVIIFLVPPSFEALKERMLARSRVSEEEMKRRIETARAEYRTLFANSDSIDYLVVNDKFDESVRAVDSILCAERLAVSRTARAGMERICQVK